LVSDTKFDLSEGDGDAGSLGGFSGDASGDAGRLTKVLTVGVMGVLEGRGPRSIELVGNDDWVAVVGGSARVSGDA
jgi:hypothetical protein